MSLNSHQGARGFVHLALQNLQGQRFHSLCKKPVAMLSFSYSVGFYSPLHLVRTFSVSICDWCVFFSCCAPQYKACLGLLDNPLTGTCRWLLDPSATKNHLFSSLFKSCSLRLFSQCKCSHYWPSWLVIHFCWTHSNSSTSLLEDQKLDTVFQIQEASSKGE